MHARFPKNFVLEDRLERYADAIEIVPAAYRGRWTQACYPLGEDGSAQVQEPCRQNAFRAVHLDLGCGKGAYVIEMAKRNPDVLFIGMDYEPICIAYAAQHVLESGVHNAVIIPGTASKLGKFFAPGELSAITINFPTPHPKKRHASERLTTAANLASFRPLLAMGGTITLRTDSQPLFDYSLPQFEAAGYRTRWTSRDDRADHPETPLTEYEIRLSAEGATVHGICAEPGPQPTEQQLTDALAQPQSLYDYVQDSIWNDRSAYVPHGMGYAITNLRNHRDRLAQAGR